MDAEVDWALKQAGSLALDCSEIGDDRPLFGCSLSHDGKMLATWYSSEPVCLALNDPNPTPIILFLFRGCSFPCSFFFFWGVGASPVGGIESMDCF